MRAPKVPNMVIRRTPTRKVTVPQPNKVPGPGAHRLNHGTTQAKSLIGRPGFPKLPI